MPEQSDSRAVRWVAATVLAALITWAVVEFFDMRDTLRAVVCWIEQQSGGDCM